LTAAHKIGMLSTWPPTKNDIEIEIWRWHSLTHVFFHVATVKWAKMDACYSPAVQWWAVI